MIALEGKGIPEAARKLGVFAQTLQVTNKHFANLEKQVRGLKRKLAVTEIDLESKHKALNDITEKSGSVLEPPVKRRRKAADSLKENTDETRPSFPGKVEFPGNVEYSAASPLPPTSKGHIVTTVISANQKTSSNASKPKPLANRKVNTSKAVYINASTSTEESSSIRESLQETVGMPSDVESVSADPSSKRPTALQQNFIQDFKLIQTLLLPPVTSGSIPCSEADRQNVLLDQALDVISQTTQALRLAYSSVTNTQGSQEPQQNMLQPTCVAEVTHDTVTVKSPNRMVDLVATVLSRFLPAILGRLEGSAAQGKVIFAVAKGVIKPAIEHFRSHFFNTRGLEDGRVHNHQDIMATKRFLHTTKKLLGSLLQVVPEYSLADQIGSPGRYSPFMEMIAFWSTEALCTGIRTLRTSSTTSERAELATLDENGNPVNGAIAALVELTGKCLPYLNSSSMNAYAPDKDSGAKTNSTVRSVATRVCDSITQLIAELDVDANSSMAAFHGDTQLDAVDQEEGGTAERILSETHKQSASRWVHLGIDRENLLAICRLAECLMVHECQDVGDEAYDGVYGWLENLMRKE
ncbi:hypothetical protein QFC19_005130 [Naganishia cerealis]|uniref:Uncharacterized protein n=1 Tax=Naganishia cerealis TaxID=610337 RepID=A0ACC2VQX6_9TREE|nr:hypothetical protein QFC19_005130 [Naganishia cerealis]